MSNTYKDEKRGYVDVAKKEKTFIKRKKKMDRKKKRVSFWAKMWGY